MGTNQTTTKERPILFSGAMVRALLAGTKTQTRRAISGKHIFNDEPDRYKCHGMGEVDSVAKGREFGALFEDLRPEITPWFNPVPCPYGEVGDRLWVRESHAFLGERLLKSEGQPGYLYRADSNEFDGAGIKWKPSIHMPRAASRLLLEITDVRCERLQAISEADAVAEGIRERYFYAGHQSPDHVEWKSVQPPHGDGKQRPLGTYEDYSGGREHLKPVASYRTLWQKINGPDSWAANPWVWVVEFKRV